MPKYELEDIRNISDGWTSRDGIKNACAVTFTDGMMYFSDEPEFVYKPTGI